MNQRKRMKKVQEWPAINDDSGTGFSMLEAHGGGVVVGEYLVRLFCISPRIASTLQNNPRLIWDDDMFLG